MQNKPATLVDKPPRGTFSGENVPKATKIIYPFSTIGRDMSYTLVSMFLLLYVQYTLKSENQSDYVIKIGVIMAIIFVVRIWDGINDPMMGTIIENVKWKSGLKYKPWILIGAITNSIVLALLFTLRPSGWWFVLFFGVFYLLWEMTFTMNDIAFWSVLPSLSKNERVRNQLTTYIAVGASIGAFAVGGIVPMVTAGNAIATYKYVGIIVALIFLASQLLLYFTCKERVREECETSEKISLKDMFLTIINNKQLLVMLVVITIYYLGSALLQALGLNFFIFLYGYKDAGSNMLIFTIGYALGTIIPQALYSLIAKKFTRKQILTISFIVMVIGNLILFGYGMAYVLDLISIPNIFILAAIGVFVFSGSGLFYMALLVMITNTIEYNQWRTGKRKESIIFAARPFAAKLSDSLKTLLVFILLTVGGVYTLTQQISDIEIARAAGIITTDSQVHAEVGLVLANANNIDLVLSTLLFGMTIIPLILFVVAYLLLKRFYKIDEVAYKKMCLDIENGNIGIHNKL